VAYDDEPVLVRRGRYLGLDLRVTRT
jgi:hypothetical protein